MKVLVTGSCGLIGAEAVRYYDKRAERVVGIDNNMRAEFFGRDGDTTWRRVQLQAECPRYKHVSADIRDRQKISDIVSEREVPPRLKVNPRLWGECLVGALTQDGFLAALERAGFYGLTLLRRSYWKEVEGYPFFSVTVQGFKYEKTAGCVFQGHRAVYLGPGKLFVDEEGHQFPRNEPYEVCTDSVAKLCRAPYREMFAILEPGDDRTGYACCTPGEGCC